MKRPATGSRKTAGEAGSKPQRVGRKSAAAILTSVGSKRARPLSGRDHDKLPQDRAARVVVKGRFDGLTGLSIVTDPPSGRAGRASAEAAAESAEAFDVVVAGKHLFQLEPAALKWLQNYSDEEIHTFVVPKRTLARRVAAREPLSVEETDKAVRLGRIDRLAADVFGDPAKAHRWLRKPKRALGGETPLAYLATEAGARAVEEMLNQIDHGILA
jgi:putative toxin-antitoxin system antitoxin component (TIGR02293 family)